MIADLITELAALTAAVARRDGDLAGAGILGAVVENDLGPAGHSAVLQALGRAVTATNYRDGIAVAAEALSRFGSADLRAEYLAPVLAGKLRLTVVWSGALVSEGMSADLFLVPRGDEVFVVPAHQVHREPVTAVDSVTGARDARVVLDAGSAAALTGVPKGWMRRQRTLAVCAEQAGVLRATIELTAAHAREREQFGRPIGSFQAVSQRLADAYIDLRAAELTLAEAVASGTDAAVATAAYWAAEAGHRVAHTCVHVHGGTGIDTEHPAHRHFARLKRLEFETGGPTAQLRWLAGIDLIHP